MKYYMRKSDSKFPCYQAEVDRGEAEDFVEVVDVTPEFNRETHRLGKWSSVRAVMTNGVAVYEAERELLSISPSEQSRRLEVFRSNALESLEAETNRAYEQLGSTRAGRIAEYELKAKHAAMYLSDPTLTVDDVPTIFKNVGTSDGATPEEVATLYNSMRIVWESRVAEISAARRAVKDAIEAATTITEVIVAKDNLTFEV